jgi:hypothetical protein
VDSGAARSTAACSKAMLTGHKEGLERYNGYAADGDNAKLRRFAEEIAPNRPHQPPGNQH